MKGQSVNHASTKAMSNRANEDQLTTKIAKESPPKVLAVMLALRALKVEYADILEKFEPRLVNNTINLPELPATETADIALSSNTATGKVDVDKALLLAGRLLSIGARSEAMTKSSPASWRSTRSTASPTSRSRRLVQTPGTGSSSVHEQLANQTSVASWMSTDSSGKLSWP